jgi:hypothetical protein
MFGNALRKCGQFAAISAAALMASPAAATPCWAPEAIDAARIQQFEVMLMSVSLRCRVTGVDLAGHFEHFRDTHKATLEHVLAVLEEHYGARRSVQGKRDLDHFVIQLANGFGGGRSDSASCQGFGAVLAELDRTANPSEGLETFAFAMVRDPFIDGPRCPAEESGGSSVSQPAAQSGISPARR